MVEKEFFTNNEVVKIWETCLKIKDLYAEDQEIFLSNLKDITAKIWTWIASNKCKDSNIWLSYCRIAVFGLYSVVKDIKLFEETLRDSFWTENINENILNISCIELNNVPIMDTRFLNISVYNGYVEFLTIFKKEYSCERIKEVYDDIYLNCRNQSRFSYVYYVLLSQYISVFNSILSDEDYNNIFELIYYNLDKKESNILLKKLLDTTNKTNAKNLFSLLISISWKHKYKYMLLNELIENRPFLAQNIDHEDFSEAFVYALNKPHLYFAAAKLYSTVINDLSMDEWLLIYFPKIENILNNTGTPTVCQRNLYKYYLPTTFKLYPKCFTDILDNFLQNRNQSEFTVLNLVIIGIKQSIFERNYDYSNFIKMGQNHSEDCIRYMSFEILCLTCDVSNNLSYEEIKNFIVMNINSVNQSDRETVKKSFERFLKKLQTRILDLKEIESSKNIVNYSCSFIEWIIPFLLNQFRKDSNHRRLAFSLNFLDLTLMHFSKNLNISKQSSIKLQKYIQLVDVLENLNKHFDKFMNMLLVCTTDKNRVIALIFRYISMDEMPKSTIMEMLDQGKEMISNSNMEIAEVGENLVQFSIQYLNSSQDTCAKTELNLLFDIMQEQWRQLKDCKNENVTENNSLHSLISATEAILHFYETVEYEKFLNFLKEVVENLLNVFELRAMRPFKGTNCSGIAQAFKDQDSIYHACTVNSMWLVLKASYKLAAKITSILKTDNSMSSTLQIIFSVIQRCYHKGALEFAGETLTEVINKATKENYAVPIIEKHFRDILYKIPQVSETSSTVRRAAETRIIVSSVAMSDSRFNKPLYHETMSFLVETLKTCLNSNYLNVPVYSMVLYCLRPLIRHSVVDYHVVDYLANVWEYCAESFKCSNYTIQNAALQTFQAVIEKMLGPKISDKVDDTEQRLISLEEILYKYPSIFNCLVNKLKLSNDKYDKHLDAVIPIFTFIGMSSIRGDNLVSDKIKTEIKEIFQLLENYIKCTMYPPDSMLAIRAFVNVCTFENLSKEIARIHLVIIENQSFDTNEYFSVIFTLKNLFDKYLENSSTLPFKDNFNDLFKKYIEEILNHTIFNKEVNLILTKFILFRYILKLEQSYKIETENINFKSTELWTWFECNLNDILLFENLEITKFLVLSCLSSDTPSSLKSLGFNTLYTRVSQSEYDKQFCEKEYLNYLIEFLYVQKFSSIHYVLKECIELILKLNLICLQTDVIKLLFRNIEQFKEGVIPVFYMPVFCYAFNARFGNNDSLRNFFYYCAKRCLIYLEEDEDEPLVLKSVKYICSYASKHNDYKLRVLCLQNCFKMLQIADEPTNKESGRAISYLFDNKETHVQNNINYLINSNNLIYFISPSFAMKFLMGLYIDRDNEPISTLNVFEQKPTLYLETSIIENDLIENIQSVLSIMSNDDNLECKNWLSTLKIKCDNHYITKLQSYFKDL